MWEGRKHARQQKDSKNETKRENFIRVTEIDSESQATPGRERDSSDGTSYRSDSFILKVEKSWTCFTYHGEMGCVGSEQSLNLYTGVTGSCRATLPDPFPRS